MALSLVRRAAQVLLFTTAIALQAQGPAGETDFAGLMQQATEAIKQGQFQNAEALYRRAVALEPLSAEALRALANVVYQSSVKDRFSGSSRFDEAKRFLERAISIDNNSFGAHDDLARMIAAQCIPSLMQANLDAAATMLKPGDLPYGPERRNLNAKIGGLLEQAFQHERRALEIDPNSPAAMREQSVLLVLRSSIDETPEASEADRQAAREWLRKAQAASGTAASQGDPGVVRIGSRVAESNLIGRVDPVYPPAARAIRLQGVVAFTAIIDEQGHVIHATLVRGHPMLVQAAKDAVMQWIYRPTLMNGQPVKVMTEIQVPFRLAE